MPHTPPPSRKILREFGLLISLVTPLLLGWLLPSLHGAPFRTWTLWISGPALILGLLWPRALAWPYRGWMGLGQALGWLNSHLILGLVHLLMLQPLALLMRALGHDPLRRRATNAKSYRETRSSNTINLKRIF